MGGVISEIADPASEQILAADGTSELLPSFTAPRPSIDERRQAGKLLRRKVPRTEHAGYRPSLDRRNPVDILVQQNQARLPRLVPVRFARMLETPFAFLRGSAAVMASDLAETSATGIYVNACGDMHIGNFGVFGSAERKLVFAINDFDEVHPGPWEWDLKRLAISAAMAVDYLGGDSWQAFEAAAKCVRCYRKRISNYAEMGALEVWYSRIDERAILEALSPKSRRTAERNIVKTRLKGHRSVLEKMAEQVSGDHRIVEKWPLIVREKYMDDGEPIEKALDAILRSYLGSLPLDRRRLLARYRIVDVARKVVGVGSIVSVVECFETVCGLIERRLGVIWVGC